METPFSLLPDLILSNTRTNELGRLSSSSTQRNITIVLAFSPAFSQFSWKQKRVLLILMNTVQTPPYPESYLAQVEVAGFVVTAQPGTIRKILHKLRTVHLAGVSAIFFFFFFLINFTSSGGICTLHFLASCNVGVFLTLQFVFNTAISRAWLVYTCSFAYLVAQKLIWFQSYVLFFAY